MSLIYGESGSFGDHVSNPSNYRNRILADSLTTRARPAHQNEFAPWRPGERYEHPFPTFNLRQLRSALEDHELQCAVQFASNASHGPRLKKSVPIRGNQHRAALRFDQPPTGLLDVIVQIDSRLHIASIHDLSALHLPPSCRMRHAGRYAL